MGDTVGGRYALDGRLGEGGMGQVYRARHLQLGKAFALKLISPAYALDAAARARFNEEAKLASEITHPNIVSVVDFGEDARFGAYMVMELVEGEPLINEGGGPLSVRRACDILAQIADALEHIHRRGIIHGDVKADNIMLAAAPGDARGARRRRIARLLDFGLARRPDASVEEEVSGSPHYLAPERAAGGPPSVSADLYALGVLGYLLLTGHLPFTGEVVELLMAHIHAPPPPLTARRGEPLDPAVEALILRALAKDPARRHASAAAFRRELDAVVDALEHGRRRHPVGTGSPDASDAAADPRALIGAAFERSQLPQALLDLDGVIGLANRAFLRLIGHDAATGEAAAVEGLRLADTTIGAVIPGLQRAIQTAHAEGKPCERRARVFRGADQTALELTLWLAPVALPGHEVQIVVRVDEVVPRRVPDSLE